MSTGPGVHDSRGPQVPGEVHRSWGTQVPGSTGPEDSGVHIVHIVVACQNVVVVGLFTADFKFEFINTSTL